MRIQNSNLSCLYKRLYATSAFAAVALCALPMAASADVVTGTFVSGSGSFDQSVANKTTITVTSQNSIANFSDYNIGLGQTVSYLNNVTGGAGNANHLSRVTGGNPSNILGTITSTGVNVWLINPNGVFFSNTATVNVPNLVVSTSGITNANFNAGNYDFDTAGAANASIINNGDITVANAGLAALVAPNIENNGTITANSGRVKLGAGEIFTLDFYGDGLINFATGADNVSRGVSNSGAIHAAGGKVLLNVQNANNVVNNIVNIDGLVEADTATVKGNIVTLGSSADITASNVNIEADDHIDLNTDINTPNLSGSAPVVNVASNSGNINQAITLVNSGGNVNLGSGTFNQLIDINKDLNLTGNGTADTIIMPYSLQFGYTNSAGEDIFPIINIHGTANVNITGLQVNGTSISDNFPLGDYMAGISFSDSASGSVTNSYLSFKNPFSQQYGIGNLQILATSPNLQSISIDTTGDVNISNNLFGNVHIKFGGPLYTATSPSIAISVTKAGTNTVISDNTIINSGIGIKLSNTSDIDILNNSIRAANTGIEIDNSDNISITGTEISYTEGNGIIIADSDIITIENIYIHDNTGTGIYASGSDDISIINGSRISSNGGNGIDINNSAGLTISGVTVSGNSGNGIYINAVTGVSGNVMVAAPYRYPLFNTNIFASLGGIGAVIESSTVELNGLDGIKVVNGSDYLRVSNVDINNNTGNGINISDSRNLFISTEILSNSGNGILLTSSDDTVIFGSGVSDNGLDGIALVSSDNVLISNHSRIYDNTNNGINADNSTGLNIYSATIYDNSDNGVLLNNSNAAIELSSIHSNGDDGIEANNSGVALFGTAVNTNDGNGILLNDSDMSIAGGEIAGNEDGIQANYSTLYIDTRSTFFGTDITEIYNNRSNGIELTSSDNVSIYAAAIFGNGDSGIDAFDSHNLTVSASDIYDNTFGIIADISDDLHIDSTSFSDNGFGVYLIESYDAVIENSSFTGSFTGVAAELADGLIMNNITASGNLYGTVITGSYDVSLNNLTYSDNDIDIYAFGGFDNLSIQNSTFTGGTNSIYSLLINGNNDALNTTLTNLTFNGTHSDATIQFEDATSLENVVVSGLQLSADAPVGWRFSNVSGSAHSVTLETGDMDFNDTIFNNSYTLFDIELVNSTTDGDVSNSVFVGANSIRDIEARIWHNNDDSSAGLLFPIFKFNIGTLANEMANNYTYDDYYHPLSYIGRALDVMNLANNYNVNLSTAFNLNSIEPAAGGTARAAKINCSTSYGNDFLGDNINQENASGTCAL